MRSKTINKVPVNEAQLLESLLKVKDNFSSNLFVNKENLSGTITTTEAEIQHQEITYETNKSLKELKEQAILLRQKLDTLDSEKNVMDVEYSQV